jgi:beta-N-acetylhexosaminidase
MAAIFGCAGHDLSPREAAFFAEAEPFGFILFQRNCDAPDQVRALTGALRAAVGRDDAPILIDQEGGRVARLKPPHWRAAPPAAAFGRIYAEDAERGIEAARLNARLLAWELTDLGIDVDCTPVLDVPQPGADPIIGDRAYGSEPAQIAALGRAVCEGLMAGGVFPVIKHIPGHGRAGVDSHKALPVVDAALDDLEAIDFAPFRALADMPFAMTAHVVYTAVDAERPATVSPELVSQVIRQKIGFSGLLMSDDLSMEALSGDLGARTQAALAAGCDIALHCAEDMAEREAVAAAAPPLSAAAWTRWQAIAGGRAAPDAFDREAAAARLDGMLGAEYTA